MLEDGGFGVFVDGDDRLGGLHAGPVLDGAGDADGHVQLGGDGLAGLADLELVGYQPASVTARDAPTAAPRASASSSMILNPSADPVPRPPETTICASVRSGRSPLPAAARSVTFAVLAASDAAKVTGTISAAAGDGSALTAFGPHRDDRGALGDPGVHGDRAAEVRLLRHRRPVVAGGDVRPRR